METTHVPADDLEHRVSSISRRAARLSAIGALLVTLGLAGGSFVLVKLVGEKALLSRRLDAEVSRKQRDVKILERKLQDEQARLVAVKTERLALEQQKENLEQKTRETEQQLNLLLDQIDAAKTTKVWRQVAREAAQTTTTPDPKPTADARDLWRRGQSAWLKHDEQSARDLFEKSLAADPGYAPAYKALGQIEEANSVVVVHPKGGPSVLRHDPAKLDAAALYYQKAIDAWPTYGAAIYDLASMELRRGHRDEALRLARRLVDLRPDDALARALQNRVESALAALPR